jgi:hypothetical protein
VRKTQIRREKCARACHVGAAIFFPPSTNQAFFFSLPSANIPCSPSGYEVEIHDKRLPHNKKKQHHFHIESDFLLIMPADGRWDLTLHLKG